MKYGNMAKRYQFERGAQSKPEPEDASWLTDGEKKKFAAGQFEKFTNALEDLRSKMRQKLIDKGIIDG